MYKYGIVFKIENICVICFFSIKQVMKCLKCGKGFCYQRNYGKYKEVCIGNDKHSNHSGNDQESIGHKGNYNKVLYITI